MKVLFIMLFMTLALQACSKGKYSKAQCYDLQVRASDGGEKARHEFETHCTVYNIRQNIDCGSAVADSKVGEGKDYLLKTYGPEVRKCFKKSEEIEIFGEQ